MSSLSTITVTAVFVLLMIMTFGADIVTDQSKIGPFAPVIPGLDSRVR